MASSSPYLHKVGSLIRTPEVTFRVEQNLGYGGMGEAHRVINRMLNDDQIVLKVMHPEFARDPEARENFAWEARVGRKIKHENLARVEWLGNLDDADKTPYFLMEYVAGKTLRNTLKEVAGGRLEVEQALTISGQMVRGLGALHERGIVHQDMKPSNIMLCRGPQGDLVKLIDLGVMRVLSVHGDSTTWAGTPAYSAREQIVGEPVGAWTDLFAVSVILFEMLAGETPYAKYGGSPAGAIARMDVAAPSLAGYGSFPAEVVALVAKGLQVRSEDRFRSASEMETAIEKVLRGLQAADPHEAVTRPTLAGPPQEGEEHGELGAVHLAGPTNEMTLDELHHQMGLDTHEGRPPPAALESEPASPYSATKPSGFAEQLSEEKSTAPGRVVGANGPAAQEPRIFGARADASPPAPAVAAPAASPVVAVAQPRVRIHATEPLPRGPRPSVLDAVTAPNQHAPLSAPASDGRVQYLDRPPVKTKTLEMRGAPQAPAPAPAPIEHLGVRATPVRQPPFERAVASSPTPSPVQHRVATPVQRPPVREAMARESVLQRVRAKVEALLQSMASDRTARRKRSTAFEREKADAEKRKLSAKALARAERVEEERLARTKREREREERELAAKQRQVSENRRRIREAEARGEQWTGHETARPSLRVQLIIAAVIGVLFVSGLLAVPAVQRRLGWQTAAAPAPGARSGR
ncbi:hypothetical protein BH11MYX4_BH11MYX4_29630 [soil metagenome]